MNQLMKTGVHSVSVHQYFSKVYLGNTDTQHIDRWLGGDGITWAGAGVWYYPLCSIKDKAGISIRDVNRSSASPSYTTSLFSESIS